MIPDDVLEAWDEAQLELEWHNRAKLKSQMVGRLYPSILQEELIQIQVRQAEIRQSRKEGSK